MLPNFRPGVAMRRGRQDLKDEDPKVGCYLILTLPQIGCNDSVKLV
jgi:hypothetical protein